jgi:hypothetical protein
MKTTKALVCALVTQLLVIGVAKCGDAPKGADVPTLRMHVEPRISAEKEVRLHFHLRYEGKTGLEVEASTLPGVQRRHTIAVEVGRYPDYDNKDATPCGNLEEIITIDDPGPGWRVVQPGAAFDEDVKLDELYKGIDSMIGRCEVVINWSYKMYTRDEIRFPRMAGSVVVPWDARPIVPPDIVVRGSRWKYEHSHQGK